MVRHGRLPPSVPALVPVPDTGAPHWRGLATLGPDICSARTSLAHLNRSGRESELAFTNLCPTCEPAGESGWCPRPVTCTGSLSIVTCSGTAGRGWETTSSRRCGSFPLPGMSTWIDTSTFTGVITRVAVVPYPPLLVPDLTVRAGAETEYLRNSCLRAVSSLTEIAAEWVAVGADRSGPAELAPETTGTFAEIGRAHV